MLLSAWPSSAADPVMGHLGGQQTPRMRPEGACAEAERNVGLRGETVSGFIPKNSPKLWIRLRF